MATTSTPTSASPALTYFSAAGGSPPRNHYRRPSLKKTITPVSPGVSAPRTHCPRDVDAFSFNPSHLPAWSMPQDLWEALPDRLRPHLVGVQHAGAAVLTGFERLKEIRTTLLTDLVELEEPQVDNAQASMGNNGHGDNELDALLNNLGIDSTAKGPRVRHDSLATPSLSTPSLTPSVSEVNSDRSADSSMPGTPGDSSPVTPASPPAPISPFSYPVDKPIRSHTPPPASPASTVSPLSPDPETPGSPTNTPATPTSTSILSPLHPFAQPPRHPHATYYAAEMAELRCVALVRLRHAARRVDAEWGECKRVGIVRPSEREADARMAKEFELWWAGKKGSIGALEERIRRIERLGLGLSGFM